MTWERNYPEPSLCIGGPKHGKRVTVLHGDTFCVPNPLPRPSLRYADAAATVAYSATVYKPFRFTFNGEPGAVWVPKDWDVSKAIAEVRAFFGFAD